MSNQYEARVTRVSVLPSGQPLFSEQCTHITIDDSAAGEYVVIEQQSDNTDAKCQQIEVDPEEWPCIRQAVDELMRRIDYRSRKEENV